MLYSVSEGKWEADPASEKSCDEVALPSPHSLVRPCRAHSLAPAASLERPRAQRMSMMARQRHPQGLVIDRSEHVGNLGRYGVRTGAVNTPALICPDETPIKC